MAWTPGPRYQIGVIQDSGSLNTKWTANFAELSQHPHAGGSGSGTRDLGGSAIGLTVLYVANAAAPAAPTGTITILFTSGSMLGHISSGGTALMLTSTAHTHGY